MKYIWILLILGILNSCSTDRSNRLESAAEASNCPSAPNEPPKIDPKIDIGSMEDGFYNAFNYRIDNIAVNKDTIAASSFDYKFTLCRANDNWTVERKPNNAEDYNSFKANQVRLEDKTYQYRVKLDTDNFREADRVILELTTPESNQPQQQILYTLEQTKQADAGIQLGEPEISKPIVYEARLFWWVYTYHGEGFGGIATIVSYDPATDEITVIQPLEIASQIINDLVISGQPEDPTFWIATQLTGEGNPRIPSMALVAYRPNGEDYTPGEVDSYRVDNSPIVGAIPAKLQLEDEILWIGTGNGICQVNWRAIARFDSWICWRFALNAKLPNEELPVYSSVLDQTPDGAISSEDNTVEVLWWSLTQREPVSGRYEIRHESPTTLKSDRGATIWSELYQSDDRPPVWQPPVYWIGSNWHWSGDRFIRGLDEVELNMFGGGPTGIGSEPTQDYIFDHKAIRGDLELLKLTENTTKVKYYSAWVEDSLLQPYLTLVPHNIPAQTKPNPLLEIKSSLD